MSDFQFSVSVRTLCDFTAKQGDIDIRFIPAPTGAEGVAGHGVMAARRGGGYLKEIPLEGFCSWLRVRGRADGYDPDANRLEEFKTYRGDLSRMRSNHRALHWAQLKVYGALMCRARGLDEITLALVYFNVRTEQESAFEERLGAPELERHFAERCGCFAEWARMETEHRRSRDDGLSDMSFPLGEMRAGQRQLAEKVFRATLRGGALMAQAPTGVGKTLGTLFPVLKAAPKAKLDKVFFLTAKTSGRRAALDALQGIRAQLRTGDLRVLEYCARDSVCEYPGKACAAEECPLAAGFYDRLPGARMALLNEPVWDRETVRRIAQEQAVCPYYLSQEMLRWSDVIVGDYNYYFDSAAVLHALTTQDEWRVGLLIDEAHNLLTRARGMYSATLSPEALRLALQHATPAVGRALRVAAYQWDMLDSGAIDDYTVHPSIPEPVLMALSKFVSVVNDHLDTGAAVSPTVQSFYFDALHFVRMADAFADHSLFDSTRHDAGSNDERLPRTSLCIRNVAPAVFLTQRFAAAAATVLFSATLSPRHYHQRLLGLPDVTGWADVASPFSPEQLTVHVQSHISTRFARRRASLQPIADLIARQFSDQPGTYLAFFSSFEYLDAARRALESRHPLVPVWAQSRQMTAAQREAFLARFRPGACGIGFAVLGGVFAEGVDLAGSGLAGAFIATLGLPQVNGVNSEFERRMQLLFGAGYEFTYLYPGLQKVVQAAGRVIRGPTDRGTLHLIDDRFSQPQVRDLLPAWWQIKCS